MSIRDDLAQVIAVALAETNPSGLGAFDELSPNRQKQLLSRGGHAADAILARFVVEKPPARRRHPLALSLYFMNPERDHDYLPGTREWDSLADIPGDVDRVLDCTGDVVRRLEDGSGWRPLYDDGSDMETNLQSDNLGPFTELRKAVQS
ncbi:hypothetical protein ACRAJ3_11510 [Rhodococcus pyridinivorans]|uniref:hypothetical protein n=1 Tax=Rhodococcus pyridinivorans TaxID=103816 RepID=UPI003D7F6EA6